MPTEGNWLKEVEVEVEVELLRHDFGMLTQLFLTEHLTDTEVSAEVT